MKDEISFEAQIGEQDLYRFSIHHAYTSSQGVISIVIVVLLMAAYILQFQALSATYKVLYPVISIMFLFYIPMTLKLKAKQQSLQDVFSHPICYTLKESGVSVSSPVAEEPAELPWEYVYKVVTWKDYLLIYSNRVNAYIIPKSAFAHESEEVKKFISDHVTDYKLSIKKW